MSCLESYIVEHSILKNHPGAIGVYDSEDGTLGGPGMSGAEALEGGPPAELSPLFFTAADSIAEECIGPGDPGSLESVDGPAGGIAEFGVVEGEGGRCWNGECDLYLVPVS